MSMSSGSSNRAVPYINVTPLIDVLLVVIIIFMVVTPLKPSRFKADIPTQRDPNENIQNLKPNPLTLVVSITPDLQLKLNQDAMVRKSDEAREVRHVTSRAGRKAGLLLLCDLRGPIARGK